MRDPVLWRCSFDQADRLTVGKVFGLHCEGSLGVRLESAIRLELPKETPPFTLELLGVSEKTDTHIKLFVTSYRTGELKIPYLRIHDGKAQIESGELVLNVQSVLTEEAKPIPPFGPFGLDFPSSILYGLAFIGVLSISAFGLLWRRHRKKKALENELERNQSHMSPLRQFETNSRKYRSALARKTKVDPEEARAVLSSLDDDLRVFLLRTLRKSMEGRHRRRILKDIRSVVDEKAFSEWKKYLKELDTSKEKAAQMDKKSLFQMIEEAGVLVGRFGDGGSRR